MKMMKMKMGGRRILTAFDIVYDNEQTRKALDQRSSLIFHLPSSTSSSSLPFSFALLTVVGLLIAHCESWLLGFRPFAV